MKKLWPKHENILPVAKQNHLGKIVSGPNEIKTLLAKEYRDRLRNRVLRPDLEHVKSIKSEIFQMKMQNAKIPLLCHGRCLSWIRHFQN